MLTGVQIFLTIFDDQGGALATHDGDGSMGEQSSIGGAKLIQYQSDPIEAFKEISAKKIASEEKYSNNDVSAVSRE